MNAMGHGVPTMIGVDQSALAGKIAKLIPDYMAMGDKGGSMDGMEMPLPENTLPMMTGSGPHGAIEMGGMFSTVKVRRNLARDDYRDPGWYRAPAGSVAYEWKGDAPAASRAPAATMDIAESRFSFHSYRKDNMKPFNALPRFILGAALALSAAVACAQDDRPRVDGEIRKVDAAAGKLTIRHGEIPNLRMSGMTMIFKASPEVLGRAKEGEKISFTADRVDGALTVMSLEERP
jgi:Cu/Ag efflux protein CusF